MLFASERPCPCLWTGGQQPGNPPTATQEPLASLVLLCADSSSRGRASTSGRVSSGSAEPPTRTALGCLWDLRPSSGAGEKLALGGSAVRVCPLLGSWEAHGPRPELGLAPGSRRQLRDLPRSPAPGPQPRQDSASKLRGCHVWAFSLFCLKPEGTSCSKENLPLDSFSWPLPSPASVMARSLSGQTRRSLPGASPPALPRRDSPELGRT